MPKATKQQEKCYKKLSGGVTPRRPIMQNALKAFVAGGAISALGQVFFSSLLAQGLTLRHASGFTSVIMIFLGAFFTGLGVYDHLGRIAGMGAALPITGFANSIVAPALEFKREGFVLGVAARMFTIAGPVLVFVTVASSAIGLVYWLLWFRP
ncbi:MAG: SpoVA/SpoVAEb family sporulation membrane protein [Bacillota bacterium]